MTSVRAIDEKELEFLKSEEGQKFVEEMKNRDSQDIEDDIFSLSKNDLDNDNEINDLSKLHTFILNKPILSDLLTEINSIRTEDIKENNKYTHQFTESEIEEFSELTKNHPEVTYINLVLADLLGEWFVFDSKQLSNLKPGDHNPFSMIVATATEIVLSAFEENKSIPVETIRDYIALQYDNLKQKPVSYSFEISEPLLEFFSDKFINAWKKRLEELKIKENPIDRAVYGTKDFVKKGAKKVGNVGKVVSESKVVNDLIDSPIGGLFLFIIIFFGVVPLIVWLVTLFFD